MHSAILAESGAWGSRRIPAPRSTLSVSALLSCETDFVQSDRATGGKTRSTWFHAVSGRLFGSDTDSTGNDLRRTSYDGCVAQALRSLNTITQRNIDPAVSQISNVTRCELRHLLPLVTLVQFCRSQRYL